MPFVWPSRVSDYYERALWLVAFLPIERYIVCVLFSDLSDVPENLPMPAPGSESPQALNYSQIASAAVAVSQGGQDPSVSSTETLLRNIQGLLKVAADNARQQERQINYEKGQWPPSAISLSVDPTSDAGAALTPISLDNLDQVAVHIRGAGNR